MKSILVLCPFRVNFTPTGGSPIRIKGYTTGLLKEGVDLIFAAPVKPDYINEKQFLHFTLKRYVSKLLLLHNLLYYQKGLGFISLILRFIITMIPEIKKVKRTATNKIIISHQENTVALFLYIVYKIDFIYDVHGIQAIQLDYKINLSSWRRFWFNLSLKHERIMFNHIKYVNSISNEMDQFLYEQMGFQGKCFRAPDGLLNKIKHTDALDDSFSRLLSSSEFKDILFFGEFKKFGGIDFLTNTFVEMVHADRRLRLVAIGKGHLLKDILYKAKKNNLAENFIHIPQIPFTQLYQIMLRVDSIVIPDIPSIYNEMIPHIKLYDAFSSGKPVVVPGFQVNRRTIEEFELGNVVFFEPGNSDSLISSIYKSFEMESSDPIKCNEQVFKVMNYLQHGKSLLKQYKAFFT